MTAGELIERLSEYDEDTPVHMVIQPSYPLESHIEGVKSREEMGDELGDPLKDGENIIYITEGGQIGYGDKRAWSN